MRFPWTETRSRLLALLSEGPLELDARGRSLVRPGGEGCVRLTPPLLQSPALLDPFELEGYLELLEGGPGRQCLILIQAGAAALGLWVAGELRRHKVLRRYVVRGRGRAQPTHLRRKGKSRYGSRLRLRNARRLLAEVNGRLLEWHREVGGFDALFTSCPVRTFSELFDRKPPPPFPKKVLRLKIPLDLGRPSFAELLRAWEFLSHGFEDSGPGGGGRAGRGAQ